MIRTYEAMDLEKGKHSVGIACVPHSLRGNAVGVARPAAGMPEAYWAVIASLVVMQSPLGSTVPLAIQRFFASALRALLGTIESTCFGANLVAFALTIFALGLISMALRLERVGYSYAGMTLAIIVLIRRPEAPWITAAHRFAEVSIGILVALAVVAVWRGEQRLFGRPTVE